ncbi:tetratricopeptide repeat protein [Maribellus comscasis]|uniref:Tetratricopeptide repeat protein n=1 Tax=Maribellus comscasis TaxID=2681766 RepID=A0A6I6JZD7_9BACT|nr:tetratricopeptide repeat protein [Maribellus comscasis]QGY46528.1 tetratricopeptide repeat protein [Maribellus comscasis]
MTLSLRFFLILCCIAVTYISRANPENPEKNAGQGNEQTKTNADNKNVANWIDSLNNRVINNSINIYDPDKFLKSIIKDTSRLLTYWEYSKANKNSEAESFVLNMLGKNKLNNSDYSKAIQYHQKAFDAALRSKNDYLEALSLNMMGVVYRRMSAVKTALEYYMRALKTAQESNNTDEYMLKSMAISNEGIGGLFRMLEQYESAIEYYKSSLQYEEQLGSLLGMAIDNHNIGKTYGLLGDYESAIFYHNRSLEYNQQLNSVLGKAICYNSLGNISMHQNEYDKAYNLFVPALKMAKQAGDSTYIVNSYTNLGWYHLTQHQNDSANIFFQYAIAISKRIGYKAALLKSYNMLSELEQQRSNYKKALSYFMEANKYKDSIANDKNRQYIADLTILNDIENQKRKIEKLEYKDQLNKKNQKNKNIVIVLLGLVALILVSLILQGIQTNKKNKLIHRQKEDMFKMQLELKVLQNERLLAENKQKESEKQLLKSELEANELTRQSEIKAMQKEIDHKNRELTTAAAYAIKKSESMRAFLDNIDRLKVQHNNSETLDKLRRDIEKQMDPDSDWDNFSLYFEEVHPNYFRNLKKKHPNLTKNELRLCSYLIMNLSNKEIALLLYISADTVQKAKYRLKKKLLLSSNDSLFDYLLTV